jgi:DNA-binding MarR family transcriptional regulator
MDLSTKMMDASINVKRAASCYDRGVGRNRRSEEFIERFSAVKKRVQALAGQAYAELELGSGQAKLLRHIGRNARISQAALARATENDPTLTSRTLALLIDRKLVRRERSDEDRREYVLELTAAGQRLRERVEKARTQLFARVVNGLDDHDFDDFERIAAKILAT